VHWPPSRGDGLNQCERWTLDGVAASNTDRGRLFVEITATTLKLFKDRGLGAADQVAEVTGGHGASSTRTKKALVAVNTSGITGSVYFSYQGEDAVLEVYPILATDSELATEVIDFARWPKESGETTFENQHTRTREEFVQKMFDAYPPQANRLYAGGSATGTRSADSSELWVVNDVGDYELKKLQNPWSWKTWAIHHTIAKIVRTTNRVLEDTDQLEMQTDHAELATAAFAAVTAHVDGDFDLDADTPLKRYKVSRG
jgi:hypothetical protein